MLSIDSALRLTERATAGLANSVATLQQWARSDVSINQSRHPAHASTAWFAHVRSDAPPDALLEIGDAVFWARSALDHLAWDAYLRCGGDPHAKVAKRIYFPVRRSAQDFAGVVNQQFPGLPADARAVFESLQDFRTSSTRLDTVNQLSVDIRHRALAAASVPSLKIEFVAPGNFPGFSFNLEMPSYSARVLEPGHLRLASVTWLRDDDGMPATWEESPPLPDLPMPEARLGVLGFNASATIGDLETAVGDVHSASLAYRSIVGAPG